MNAQTDLKPSVKTSAKTVVEINKVIGPIQPGLAQVEAKMKNIDSSLFAPLAHAFVDLIGSGGKRLRPILALLAAQVREEQGNRATFPYIVALAASVEMLHTATLVHDDVIDGALLRRGAPTLNATWDRGATILAGNFMFARAAYFAAETNNPRVIRIFADTLETIVNGELHQLSARHDFVQEKDGYYQRIYAKTASLFAAATEAAAVLAGLVESEVQALRAYGHNLGMAFQIMDDILDFTGSDATLGKPAGSDLLGGTLTLPFFYFLQTIPNATQLIEQMQEAYIAAADGDDTQWRALIQQVVSELRVSSAIQAARNEAESFLALARANVAAFPNSIYQRALLDLCDFVVQRTY